MKKFYLMYILALLTGTAITGELTADDKFILNVRRGPVDEGDKSLTIINWDKNLDMIVTFVKDVNPGDMKLHVEFYDEWRDLQLETDIKDACNMDISTHDGTLAAMLFASMSIYSCPVKPDEYRGIYEFNQTGTIDNVFMDLFERFSVYFDARTQDDKRYFKISYEIVLVDAALASESAEVELL